MTSTAWCQMPFVYEIADGVSIVLRLVPSYATAPTPPTELSRRAIKAGEDAGLTVIQAVPFGLVPAVAEPEYVTDPLPGIGPYVVAFDCDCPPTT